MLFCDSCGTKLNENASFCYNCGKKVQFENGRETENAMSSSRRASELRNQANDDKNIRNTYVEYLQIVLSAEERCMFFEELIDKTNRLKQTTLQEIKTTKESTFEERTFSEPKNPEPEGVVFHFLLSIIFGAFFGVGLSWIPWGVMYLLDKNPSYIHYTVVISVFMAIVIFFGTKAPEAKKQEYRKALAQYERDVAAQRRLEEEFPRNKEQKISHLAQIVKNCDENLLLYKEKVRIAYEDRQALYSINILFSTYQNATACSYFLQYFLAGRCVTLRGTQGAYNLFEVEKRLDKMIDSLERMIDKLDAINNSINSMALSISSRLENIFDCMKQQNDTISKLKKEINTNMDVLGSKLDSDNRLLEDINKIEKLRLEETRRYQDYNEFALRQKRYEEGHMY